MTYRYRFTIDVEVDREEGKFASRDELGEQLGEAIEGADPGSVTGDNGGTYAVSTWKVNEEAQPARAGRRVLGVRVVPR